MPRCRLCQRKRTAAELREGRCSASHNCRRARRIRRRVKEGKRQAWRPT